MDRQDWLKWRKKGIGSSDSPIIMGVSPWKTVGELYLEKVDPFDPVEDTTNQYVKDLGNEVEPKVRSLFELYLGESFSPSLVEMEQFSFLRASLDGRSEDKKTIVEIKLSGKDDWQASRGKGIVPEKYYPQVQHALMVSGAERCFYLAYLFSAYKEDSKRLSLNNLAIIEVLSDKDYQANLLKKEIEFWQNVTNKNDVYNVKLNGMEHNLKLYSDLSQEIEFLNEKLEAVRKEIIDAAVTNGKEKYECFGFKIVKQERKGNIDYKKVPELQGVDLEKYRGKKISYWSIKK